MIKKYALAFGLLCMQGLSAKISLHTACGGYDPLEVKEAIQSGADLNETVLLSKTTPLGYVCTFAWYHKLALNYAEQLLRAGADVNKGDRHLNAPLHIACQDSNGNHHLVFLLLEYGASVNMKNQDGMTPLHIASACGEETIVSYLLQYGADVSIVDNSGNTAIDICCSDIHPEDKDEEKDKENKIQKIVYLLERYKQ